MSFILLAFWYFKIPKIILHLTPYFLTQEFKKRGVKLAALSCDSTESHNGWIKDILAYNNLSEFSYPIIADPNRDIATLYGMLDPDEKDAAGKNGNSIYIWAL